MKLILLEDDLQRIDRFKAILGQNHQLVIARTAWAFIERYPTASDQADLICLDHDLFTDSPDEPDPGDGRDVAGYLATQTPLCPALIHSTNAPAADSMMFTLRDAGWNVDRIAPIGADWIEEYWFPTMLSMVDSK
ncbi:MAG: cyclic-phosphate processing receiver domain-containing protein [Planctomycetota bacterium]